MYDYVIVGAGSAGCVLAARLSEDPAVSVLLLESGPPDVNQNIHVPLGYLSLGRTEVDWDFTSAPEPFCDNRRITLPRGRVLGGSSSINAMVYIRGNRADYDGWGIPGWTYDDLLPYFIKSEDNERGASEFHGAGGPLPVSESRSRNPMSLAFAAAAIEAGFPANDDFNGATQDGFGIYQVTQRNGMRASASVAYLHPAMTRPNLTVLPYMHVHRVLFEGTRAAGVVASQLGRLTEYRAEREVILCGGAYNSPQLLMLSGIGPAEHLTMREIEVLVDQPEVGENLSDHAASYGVWTTPEPVSLLLALEPAALEEFEATQSGPLTSNLAEGGGFVRMESGAPAPDVQFHIAPVQIVDEGQSDPTAHGLWISPCVLQPEARGSVRLQNNDPTGKPVIRNNFYASEKDTRTAVDAFRLMLEITRQPALAPYCAEGFTVPASGSEADLLAHVKRTTFAIYHPVGTCAMGTVVDDELRVLGVEGLRVVDASVMPMVPRGNTNAPTIAIAERAADLIKGPAAAAPSEQAAAV
ncbi:MAG: GMC family oxidoreductase [Solirubrobacteraceae bacterium]